MKKYYLIVMAAIATGFLLNSCSQKDGQFSSNNNLALNDSSYFETRGLNYFVFSNLYDAAFDDSKISAVEIIHHGIRTATNGDVRMNPTPGQWDLLPKYIDRIIDKENKRIDVKLSYTKYEFDYTLSGEAKDGGFYLSVSVEKPIPDALNGVAGLNLEFMPPCLFGNAYAMDGQNGLFPTSPADNMTTINGQVEPLPIVKGKKIEIAPDDPMKHITISTTGDYEIMLFDGRNKQQNGNFVVRTLLPAGKTGKIVEWFITAETKSDWIRQPVIAHSQVGYHPLQNKMAVIELDKNDKPLSSVSLLKVNNDGSTTDVLSATPKEWGIYTRYNYLQFDFSSVTESGIYVLEYGKQRTAPFPIANNVFEKTWYPTLGIFLPVQMDHVFVREAYRVWHGASHLDDALQAPVNYAHWDGWRQGATTGNKYKPLEHIPGLNVGGWFDAGDFDIQTNSQQFVVQSLSMLWENFAPKYDETTVNQKTRYVDIHVPDGQPDVLQQIEHGTLQLVAQIKSIGYAIMGINESHLYQYRHLGDALTKTDNLIYNPSLDSLQVQGNTSGTLD
ncbi:MAG: glycoside hydrolase, partial [Prevotellaceae bacterium]|nr:glycoside hydrolase [Prevotellaceae bacterium]